MLVTAKPSAGDGDAIAPDDLRLVTRFFDGEQVDGGEIVIHHIQLVLPI